MTRFDNLSRRGFGAMAGAAAIGAASSAVAQNAPMESLGNTSRSTAQPGGTEIFDGLIQDHKEIAAMLSQMQALESNSDRVRSVGTLKTLLTRHAVAEENALYPALALLANEEDQAQDMYSQHAAMKIDLYALEQAAMGNGDWQTQLQEITQTITEHVQEEERDVFPTMRETLGATAARQVEQQVEQNKQLVG